MVMLPQTVSLETAEINGTKVIKQMYADGSYGIQDDNTGCVKVYYPDGKKQWFLPIDGSYKLTAEEAPDGKMTFAQKDGIVNTEHLSRTREVIRYDDGYEFSEGWNYTVTEHLTDHKVTFYDGSIYNVSVRTHDNYIDSCGFDKTSQFTELKVRLDSKDEYGDDTIKISSEKSFDGSGHRWNSFGEAVYIKTVDGTEREWYDNGRPSYEKLPDGTERGWYADGSKKFEQQANGSRKEWHLNGKLSAEILCSDDKRKISEARYDETGKRTHFEHYDKDGKDDTRLYLAKQKVASNQVEKGAAKGKIQKKLNPLVKAIKMHKALKEVDSGK